MNEPKRPSQPAAGMPEFTTRDPAQPAFWDERFEQGFTPWDQQGVQPAFEAFAVAHAGLPVLIPGCGNAWEARWLVERGYEVRAIDFAAVAVANARAVLGEHAPVIEQADFYAYRPPFTPGWIFERAFLCALPKAQRGRYAARMAELLPPGGLLAGFFFIGDTPKGPPFGIDRAELDGLLAPHFELIDDRPVDGSLPVFAGRERWITWRRRAAKTPRGS
ncbi:methyltransferase domain-containing protein [Paraburkholderia caballeronis]|uniref:Thiopurine S-methyltransferase (TPMT) n=1 Tax=Paraburkholderia caballeronis TaxID=416943 RepID=A0A1H7PXX2_9BURK|nr:methyltransferase domain-containing protein [Paraburkholderia caballeronis]PXW24396.1 thiopurine S-methyltransferase [Paraburkholderia caballeronis]PXX00178.1 thiopurine S-methyltransferase [Paraburkholderia caballeronis]RAJ97307.1 thiopurine S-methyltransferase [Paraburkholderia caballeronis]SEB64670.1 Thiopurine S-methyltransferase (TPMT) [Paraburkholderia caballeronis]SEL40583.1 Thiopurine S-methyltransferase (TPMT) [Paraburkholderia caballeronis]